MSLLHLSLRVARGDNERESSNAKNQKNGHYAFHQDLIYVSCKEREVMRFISQATEV